LYRSWHRPIISWLKSNNGDRLASVDPPQPGHRIAAPGSPTAREPELVAQSRSASSDDRKSAKTRLKQTFLAEFKQTWASLNKEDLSALTKAGQAIGKDFKK
jgi:hypothetical protein